MNKLVFPIKELHRKLAPVDAIGGTVKDGMILRHWDANCLFCGSRSLVITAQCLSSDPIKPYYECGSCGVFGTVESLALRNLDKKE